MDDLLRVLKSICPYIDFNTQKGLLSNKVLNSVDFVSLVAGLEDNYNIIIDIEDMKKDNFDSVEKICAFIKKKQQLP